MPLSILKKFLLALLEIVLRADAKPPTMKKILFLHLPACPALRPATKRNYL